MINFESKPHANFKLVRANSGANEMERLSGVMITCLPLRAYAGHGGPDPHHRRAEAAAEEEKKRRRRHDQDHHGGAHHGAPSPAAAGGCLLLAVLLPRQRRDHLLDPQPAADGLVASLCSAAAAVVHLVLHWLG